MGQESLDLGPGSDGGSTLYQVVLICKHSQCNISECRGGAVECLFRVVFLDAYGECRNGEKCRMIRCWCCSYQRWMSGNSENKTIATELITSSQDLANVGCSPALIQLEPLLYSWLFFLVSLPFPILKKSDLIDVR